MTFDRAEAERTKVVRQQAFATTDPEVANHALAGMYGDVKSRVFGDPQAFSYQLRSGVAAGLATARMRFTMGIEIDAELEPSHHTLLAMVRGERYQVRSPFGDVVLRPGDVAIVPAGSSAGVVLDDLEVVTLSLPASELSRTAEELYGRDAAGLEVLRTTPASPGAGRYLRKLIGLASSELLTEDSALEHALIYGETLRGLSVGILEAFPTTASAARPRSDRGQVAPRALRRAVAFIDANAARAITLADVAAAAGTSARAVQHSFARQLGSTPTAYLRRVRLERAHRELQAADPAETTVATVARRWGFTKSGHFATAYREVFGVNPSETLRS